MKSLRKLSFAVAALALLGGVVLAQSEDNEDTTTFDVTAEDVNELTIDAADNDFDLSLDITAAGDDTYTDGDEATLPDSLLLSHNFDGAVTVDAEVTADPGIESNDITLDVRVADVGEGWVTILDDGSPTAAQDIWTGIASDGYTQDLGFRVDDGAASLSGTPRGTYEFTVTLTSSEDP